MKKQYATIEELLANELDDRKEGIETLSLMKKLKSAEIRGYFTKDEFLAMAMWKSPRPKRKYEINSEANIKGVSEKVFATRFEKRKIDLLTSLSGVSIPVASAILMLIDPKNYGVIDIRVWQILYLYGSVKVKPSGTNFNFKNWYNYLMKLRYYARKFKVKTRDIEITLFFHHRKMQDGTLYKGRNE